MVSLKGRPKRSAVCGVLCLVGATVAAIAAGPSSSVRDFYVPLDPPGAAYVLDAGISIENGAAVVSGTGTMTFKNTATRPLSVLAFDWSAGGSRTLEVTADGRSLRLLNAEAGLPSATPLFYLLPQPLDSGRELVLHLKFSTTAGGSTERISLPKWYPGLWWEGIQVRNSFHVKLSAPEGYAVATSGRLNPASGRYENDGVTTQFGLYLAKDMMSDERESAGVLITALFTEKGRACAVHCLDAAGDIIKFYRERFGFYPHRSLTIIPGQPQPMGGYPFAAALVVIHGQETFDPQKGSRPLPWWTWITAHEIGHQYWGECVMAADVRFDYTDAWLMIGMGIVADKEYCLARGLGWVRHRAFLDRYLQGVRAKNDTTMEAPPSLRKQQKFDTNNIVIHGKGFAVLSALEVLLGKETFAALYGRVLQRSAWRRLGWRDLQRSAEEAAGEKLDAFFKDWIMSNKALVGRIASTTSEPAGDGFVTEVRVEFGPDSIRMPVPVEAAFEDGTRQTMFTDRFSPVSRLRFASRAKLKEARLDPERRLALLADALPKTADELADAVAALDWSGTGESALAIFKNPETAKITTARTFFKLGLLLFDGGFYKESGEAFQKCALLDAEKFNLFAVNAWLGHLQDLLGEREKALEFYREALKNDTGQTMQHDQWGLRINRAWVEERLKTPFAWKR
ncbi:MAG: M1 family aminopeptidase [Candidatus Aminicenantes bacterium]|nr:M1 family aminopeptidase [Candidatus Aminicenantes bacterium]